MSLPSLGPDAIPEETARLARVINPPIELTGRMVSAPPEGNVILYLLCCHSEGTPPFVNTWEGFFYALFCRLWLKRLGWVESWHDHDILLDSMRKSSRLHSLLISDKTDFRMHPAGDEILLFEGEVVVF